MARKDSPCIREERKRALPSTKTTLEPPMCARRSVGHDSHFPELKERGVERIGLAGLRFALLMI